MYFVSVFCIYFVLYASDSKGTKAKEVKDRSSMVRFKCQMKLGCETILSADPLSRRLNLLPSVSAGPIVRLFACC